MIYMILLLLNDEDFYFYPVDAQQQHLPSPILSILSILSSSVKKQSCRRHQFRDQTRLDRIYRIYMILLLLNDQDF